MDMLCIFDEICINISIFCVFLMKIKSIYRIFVIFDETKKTRIAILYRMLAEWRRDLSYEAPS